eukprot:4102232-Prymnesium_polylepis.1
MCPHVTSREPMSMPMPHVHVICTWPPRDPAGQRARLRRRKGRLHHRTGAGQAYRAALRLFRAGAVGRRVARAGVAPPPAPTPGPHGRR